MKRKAMLMGMAVMAGMPGWAMAKNTAKVATGAHAYSDGVDARETFETVVAVNELPGASGADTPAGNAGELLAQVKDMLRSANYGAAAKSAPDGSGWTVEIMPAQGDALGYGDARLRPVAPLGVALRFRF